ncbi:hypothetical protein GALL_130000 [mine drainage metagenome]|uniref:Transmembrane protein n=1 Tax=mine drainage metagenome TaxID=410659 RepID=A0A1J5SY12_9ZZZZ
MSKYENEVTSNTGNHMVQNTPEYNEFAEAQLAHSVVGLLDAHVQHVDAEISNRLLVARGLAVSQLTKLQTQVVVSHEVNQSGNVLQWFGEHVGQYVGHHRLMSFILVTAALLLAFFAAQQFGLNNNLEHSDAYLLASDLPPEAYADKGFDAWLDTAAD